MLLHYGLVLGKLFYTISAIFHGDAKDVILKIHGYQHPGIRMALIAMLNRVDAGLGHSRF